VIGGANVQGLDDAVLASAVADELAQNASPAVQVHGLEGWPHPRALQTIEDDLTYLDRQRSDAEEHAARVGGVINARRGALPKDASADDRAATERRLSEHIRANALLTFANTAHDAFLKDMLEGVAGASPGISRVLRSLTLAQLISEHGGANSVELWLRLNNAAGGYYTQRNLWTILGGPPIHYSGSVVVSYRIFDLSNGQLLEAGVEPVFNGPVRASRVRAEGRRR
jgi:hypothetical protein